MQLDSAREIKASLLSSAPPRPTTMDAEVTARGLVGVAPAGDGYRVAVRLTADDPGLRDWVARVAEQARDEVDVRVVGPVRALSQPVVDPGALVGRVRPLHRGLSVAHERVSAGTIGAFVSRAGAAGASLPSNIHLLSNSHVLADAGRGARGDAVLQPGPADGGTADDRVGELAVAVPFDTAAPNLVDAALAVLDEGVDVDLAGPDGALTGVAPDVAAADVAGGVTKIGRTTGVTTGVVTAFEVDAVPVDFGEGVTLTFDDQVEIEGDTGPFSDGGDSGSVICTRDGRVGVGLLFAGSAEGGSSGTGLTYANPLATVLRLLEAELLLP